MANEYFSRTPSVAGNRRTFTFSCWFKRIKVGSGGGNRNDIFTAGNTAAVGDGGLHFWFIDDRLRIESDGGNILVSSNNLHRDVSQAYHLVCRVDTTQSDANNRLRMYVNGSLITSLSSNSQPSQNYQYQVNNTVAHYLGVGNDAGTLSYYAGGVMSDAFLVDGQSLDPSVFGKLSSKGQWTPKHPTTIKNSITSTGGFGTNGFYLSFGSNIGYDQSGLGNNYSANNFDLNADFKSKDTISNNFCTLNQHTVSNGTLSEGGTRWQPSGNNSSAWSTYGLTSGKWYWEMKKLASGDAAIQLSSYPRYSGYQPDAQNADGLGLYMYYDNGPDNRFQYKDASGNSVTSGFPSTFTNDDNNTIYAFFMDLNARTITVRRNGDVASQATLTWPSYLFESASAPIHIGYSVTTTWPSGDFQWNFGQGTFVTSNSNNGYADENGKGVFQYQPPSGYLAICEDNIADCAIVPNNHFDSVLYTGTGSAQTITGLNFKPSLLWNISRASSGGYYPALYDDIRGPGNAIFSNVTNGNTATTDGSISAFNSNGFSLNSGGGYGNSNGGTYVVHAWKGGDTITTNTTGTRSSQTSVNAAGGFSVVNFSIASGSGEDTVGHGLGAKPDVIMMKSLNNTYNWDVWHKGLGSIGNSLILNEINYVYTNRTPFTTTEPTSNVFSVRNAFYGAGTTFTAYCWKEIAGYSRFGKYYGMNTTNYIYTGFKPAFVMIRPFTGGSNTTGWRVFDNKRNPNNVNGVQNALYWERGGTTNEVSQNGIDFMSNGFSLISASDANYNASGTTYIYMAFAEMPGDLSNPR